MGILDRFSSYVAWPVSRKIVLIGSIGVVFTLIAGGVNELVHRYANSSVMRLDLIGAFVLLWCAAQIVCTLAALPAARAQRDARWTGYLFVGVQSVFMVALLQLFGIMSSPIVAVFPAVVIFWTLALDERLGLLGMAVMIVLIGAVGVLEIQGVLPHAPLLQERALDAQNNALWFGTFLFHILVLLAFCMTLCVLFLSGRRLQDQRLAEARDALAEANRLIRRYVPTQLADQILAGAYEEASAPRRRRLSLVFVDIEGYTAASEALSANVLEEVLNRYLGEMMAVADRHGGTVNQIVGDGLLVFFGAPSVSNDRDHALRAVRMALEMQARARELSSLWSEHGWLRPFRLRIGINTGEASVGDFGPPGRKLYSAIGLQTNLAERIQTLCEPGQILMHESTWTLVHREIACQPRGRLSVKGVSEPVPVFEALAERTVVEAMPETALPVTVP
jgi:class 3 adenylate cyclase